MHSKTVDLVLRSLARNAQGFSGADIERLIRESRQRARRERRALTWADIDTALSASCAPMPDHVRWRVAVHEAGHATARLVLRLGTITLITLNDRDGNGRVESKKSVESETEDRLTCVLVAHLSGRAAEQEILGSVAAGSGGGPASDLAKASQLALWMETAFGFGQVMPLLHRDPERRKSVLLGSREIAINVNARIEHAYSSAREIIQRHRMCVEELARVLVVHTTLEGAQLEDLLAALPLRPDEEFLSRGSGSASIGPVNPSTKDRKQR